jgi:hypothetical protein
VACPCSIYNRWNGPSRIYTGGRKRRLLVVVEPTSAAIAGALSSVGRALWGRILTLHVGDSEIKISTLYGGGDEFLRVLEAAIATARG